MVFDLRSVKITKKNVLAHCTVSSSKRIALKKLIFNNKILNFKVDLTSFAPFVELPHFLFYRSCSLFANTDNYTSKTPKNVQMFSILKLITCIKMKVKIVIKSGLLKR